MEMTLIQKIGLVAGIILPLFNIPLILKIVKRKSSQDLSMTWVVGVWLCIVLMAPSGFVSEDIVWRIFNYVNVTFFTGVLIVAWKYKDGVADE